MPAHCVIGEADPFISMLLTRFAEACGLQPVQAQLGEDVYALARQLRPTVILLDGELPGDLRGWEAARRLKADANYHNIPVVSCSWLNEVNARALLPDAVAYLQKPDLHYDDFVAALRLAGQVNMKTQVEGTVADALQPQSSPSKGDRHVR